LTIISAAAPMPELKIKKKKTKNNKLINLPIPIPPPAKGNDNETSTQLFTQVTDALEFLFIEYKLKTVSFIQLLDFLPYSLILYAFMQVPLLKESPYINSRIARNMCRTI
jgi:hypothetical protein